MPDPRKGLRRYSISAYIVCGPCGDYLIVRQHRPRRYIVRRSIMHPQFHIEKFRRLRSARAFAEKQAGI